MYLGHHEMPKEYFFPDEKLHHIDPFIPMFDYYPSYFIWTKNYTRLFSIFDSTVMLCKQKVDVGIYNPDARFYFIISTSENPNTIPVIVGLTSRTRHTPEPRIPTSRTNIIISKCFMYRVH